MTAWSKVAGFWSASACALRLVTNPVAFPRRATGPPASAKRENVGETCNRNHHRTLLVLHPEGVNNPHGDRKYNNRQPTVVNPFLLINDFRCQFIRFYSVAAAPGFVVAAPMVTVLFNKTPSSTTSEGVLMVPST